MKSYNHLYEKLVNENNIRLAIKNASKNKRKRKIVQECLKDEEKLVHDTIYILDNDLFKPRDHKVKIINDGPSHKQREIIQPDFQNEQIVHHAIINVLSPIFMKGMYEYSCGSLPGRGAHHGKKYIEKVIRKDKENTQYVAKMDVKKFFKNVKHNILKSMLRKLIHDERFLNILFIIIDSYEDGLPLGYYTSQWFANFYLTVLDRFIKHTLKIKYYVRYMDDMVLFAKSKEILHKAVLLINIFLKEKLGCWLKENYQIFPFAETRKDNARCVDFMGFKFYRNYTILRKHLMFKMCRKVNKIKKKAKQTWYDSVQLMSYYGYIKYTDTYDSLFKPRVIDKGIYISDTKKIISFHAKQQNKLQLAA